MALSDLQIGLLSLMVKQVDHSGSGVTRAELHTMIDRELDELLDKGMVEIDGDEMWARRYTPQRPLVLRETLTEPVPIHRREYDRPFTYDVAGWKGEDERNMKEWFKREAAARGLDWKEQYQKHKKRMKDLKKPPGLRHREAP